MSELMNYQSLLQSDNLIGRQFDWLNQLRQQAFHQFQTLGFPSKKQEQWKYTDLTKLTDESFRLGSLTEINFAEFESSLLPDVQRLVFINGDYADNYSQHVEHHSDLIVLSMRHALEKYPEKVEAALTSGVNESGLDKLNLALMTGGMFISLPDHYQVTTPIQLLFIHTQSDVISNIRNVIHLGKASQLSLIETHVGLSELSYFNQVVNQVTVGHAAAFTYKKIQKESDQVKHIAHMSIIQHKDSSVQTFIHSLGSQLARDDVVVSLDQSGAQCSLNGLYDLNNSQHVDHHLVVKHNAPHCKSEQLYKGVLDDKATAVFNGKVIVAEGATRTSANQDNHTLLLSKTATMNTKPELEIYNDDVECSHGATVGQLDNNALFYLQSRGIESNQAIKMLVNGFMQEVLDKVTEKNVG